MATTVIYTTLGERKGTKRLWLEGRRLARAGISPGQQFELKSLVRENGPHRGITLRFTPAGDRKVSRRKRGDQELPHHWSIDGEGFKGPAPNRQHHRVEMASICCCEMTCPAAALLRIQSSPAA